ncbi:MAG: HIT domain-containing protein [Candidatus Roizmanbacteria bacterium]|nr:HIT domain-containing protein [Candidatus Roizmanbacteria bacterium]
MSDFSTKEIFLNCPHCDTKSFALKFPLCDTDNFFVTCDVHPLTKGHILIMPKKHFSCFGEYPDSIVDELVALYKKCSDFLVKTYGSVSSFEHGKIGQTVFHSHIQMFPYLGSEKAIIPEGNSFLTKIQTILDLKRIFKEKDMYLFFSIGKNMWTVDTSIGKPRFFRDRFAQALHNPKRGNWKEMHADVLLMKEAEEDIFDLLDKWNRKFKSS